MNKIYTQPSANSASLQKQGFHALQQEAESKPQPPAPVQPPQKRSKKKIGILLGVFVFFIASIAAGYILALYGVITLPFLDEPKEVVFQKMQEASAKITSGKFLFNVKYDLEMKGSVLYSSDSRLSLWVNSNGLFDFVGETPREHMNIEGEYKWEGLSFSFRGEIKLIDDNFYVKISQMPFLSVLEGVLAVGKMKDEWLLIDFAKGETVYEDIIGIPLANPYQPGDMIEMEEKMSALLQRHPEMFIVEKLRGEKIHNVNTYHFRLAVNTETFDEFLLDFINLMQEFTGNDLARRSEVSVVWDSVERLVEDHYEDIIPHLKALHIEMWIGKRDYFTRKISLFYQLPERVVIHNPLTQEEINFRDTLNDMRFEISAEYLDINKPVNIEVPEDAIDIIDQLQDKIPPEVHTETYDSQRIQDVRSIINALYEHKEKNGVFPSTENRTWADFSQELFNGNVIMPPLGSSIVYEYCYYVNEPQNKAIVYTKLEDASSKGEESVSTGVIDLSDEQFSLLSTGRNKVYPCVNPTRRCSEGICNAEAIPCHEETTYCLVQTFSGSETGSLVNDSDNDGLYDSDEQMYGTDPYKQDTDGDGFTDQEEISHGFNPLGQGALLGVRLCASPNRPGCACNPTPEKTNEYIGPQIGCAEGLECTTNSLTSLQPLQFPDNSYVYTLCLIPELSSQECSQTAACVQGMTCAKGECIRTR